MYYVDSITWLPLFLKYALVSACLLLILLNTLLNLSCLKYGSAHFSLSYITGIPWPGGIRFLSIRFGHQSFKVRKLNLKYRKGLQIEIVGVSIKSQDSRTRYVSQELKKDKVIPQLSLNTRWISIASILLPVKIVVKDAIVHLSGPERTVTCETVLLKTEVSSNTKVAKLEVVAISLRDSLDKISFHTLDYSFILLLQQESPHNPSCLKIIKHDQMCTIRGLRFYIDRTAEQNVNKDNLRNSMDVAQTQFLSRYEEIIKALNSLDLRFEDLEVMVGKSLDFHASGIILSLKAVPPPFSFKVSDLFPRNPKHSLTYETAFTVNSFTGFSEGQEFLRIPTLNANISSVIPFNLIPCSKSKAKLECTVTIVNPRMTARKRQLESMWHCFLNRHRSSKKDGHSLYETFRSSSDYSKFTIKGIITNMSFNLKQSETKHFVLRVNNLHAFGQNCHEQVTLVASDRLVNVKGRKSTRDYADNFLKIDRFSLTHSRVDETTGSKIHDIPIIVFSKWEFFSNSILLKKNDFTSTLRDLKVSFEQAEVLADTTQLISEWVSLIKSLKGNKHTVSSASTYTFRLRLKNSSVSLLVANHLEKRFDTRGDSNHNLTNYTRGASVCLEEAFLDIKPGERKLNVINASIYRVSDHSSTLPHADQVARIENLVIGASNSFLSCHAPVLKGKLDVNIVWLYYYLRDVALNYVQQPSPPTAQGLGMIEALSEKLSIEATSILLEIELPQSVNLLIALENLVFLAGSSALSLDKLKIFTPSVYRPKDVFVLLGSIDNLNIDIKSIITKNPVKIKATAVWLQFEYHLRLYIIMDNLITMVKCIKQVKTCFTPPIGFSKVRPSPENAREVFPIDFDVGLLTLNVEEDPFEQELGLIFKVGIKEQRERVEKLKLLSAELRSSSSDESFSRTFESECTHKLLEHFSTSWINRIRKAKLTFFGNPSRIVKVKKTAGSYFKTLEGLNSTVLRVELEQLRLKIRQPSFPLLKCADFLHEYGKGIPKDTSYTTLLPLGITLETSRWEFRLRDYPLPILFFPNLMLCGDLVFAERVPQAYSERSVYVPFVPMALCEKHNALDSIYGSNIVRTLNPVKTYMNLKCHIDSAIPTTITWGKALQPGYQSVMIWFDYLTKPPLDPSEKLGFWDKIRLLIHGKLSFEWANDSNIHLNIKGSHDPYLITDDGAGLSFCWGGNAKLSIHESDDPTEFLKITSDSFLLAIRDFTSPLRLEKVLMKLNGNVLWTMGLAFEAGNVKDPGAEVRTSEFKPHYMINLHNPLFLKDKAAHDSYRGFRSDFIHLFFRVYAKNELGNTNRVYLAPHCFAHFLKWWSLFSTYTSGPIRQGPLFPDLVQNPKKFSKALFTVKYELFLAPLALSHTYRHAYSGLEPHNDSEFAFTSLKGKFDSLKLELHQKRVKMMHTDEKLNLSRTVWNFKMNAGEVDCIGADIRFLYTLLRHPSTADGRPRTYNPWGDEVSEDSRGSVHDSRVLGSDWFDPEDYNDLNQISFESLVPITFQNAPLLFSPRISYLRELNEGVPLDFPFGEESVHQCHLGHNHPEVTQRELAQKRAKEIEEQLEDISKSIEADHQSNLEEQTTHQSGEELKALNNRLHEFRHRLHIIHKVLEDLKLSKLPTASLISDDAESLLSTSCTVDSQGDPTNVPDAAATIASFRCMRKVTSAFVKSSFDNRFIVHNMLFKINNKTRDLLMDYAFNVLNRKKSSFFQTYKAVALLDELLKNKLWDTFSSKKDATSFFASEDILPNSDLLERFDEIIREVVEDGLETFDNYQIRLVSPQIQITSNSTPDKCILVTARDIESSIIDVNQVNKGGHQNVPLDVNSLVETRYCAKLNEAHFLFFDRTEILSNNGLGFETHGYGMESNSKFWPPWLPMEMCYNCETLTDSVFLTRSEMVLMFTQPNSLFFQHTTKSMGTSEAKFRIGFPKLFLTSTSEQYSSIYSIAVELLYFASSFDSKAEKLSKVLLAEEVRNNLDKLDASIIVNLQTNIRNLVRTRAYLKVHDPRGYKTVAQNIAAGIEAAALELNLLMSAIKKNHDKLKFSNRRNNFQDRLKWQIGADEVTWQLFDERRRPFVVFELGPAVFIRSQAPDGANSNKVSISSLNCYNLQEHPVYKQLLGPRDIDSENNEPLIQVLWAMGPAVGGIADLEQLIVLLEPFKFKMDHLTSQILLKFLFPPTVENPSSAGNEHYAPSESIAESHSGSRFLEPARKLKAVPSILISTSSRKSQDSARSAMALRRNKGHDMNEMVSRSSRYFNVRSVVIRKVTMSISYKGSRSLITNVDRLTVKVPTLRYKNKLWSREEFIATLKKDIIKVVLQHTGYIIGNKFTLHKRDSDVKDTKHLYPASSNGADSYSSTQQSPSASYVLRRSSSLRQDTSLESQSLSENRIPRPSEDHYSVSNEVKSFYPAAQN